MKFSVEELRAILDKIEGKEYKSRKRIRISVMLDEDLLEDVNKKCRNLHYVSRNELISSLLSQFCNEGEC